MSRSANDNYPDVILADYRRRARTRETLTNFTLCGIALGAIALLVGFAMGLSSFLRWTFAFLLPHLPSFSWAAPAHRSMVEALLSLLG